MRYLHFLLFTCLYSFSFAQVPDFVKTAGITSDLHKENIGKIVFTNTSIPASNLKEADFLDTCTLTNLSSLFFIAFMENSLTNYLHQLLPEVSADSLVKIGNYQFSIHIDHHEIYTSNLLAGAPRAAFQDTVTLLNRPLTDFVNGTGSWSESFWNRFLRHGGDRILTDGKHLLRMEIRPYVQSDSLLVGHLIAAGEVQLLVNRNPEIDISKIQLNPVKTYEGFAVSTSSFDSVKIKELKAKIELGFYKKINSIIVIKNGKILIEEYFNGENRNSLHDPRSVGKSFTSTLTGIAIREGFLKTIHQTLGSFYALPDFKNYQKEKETIRIRDLLTMSSPFDGDDEDETSPGNEENMYSTPNWVKFTLDLPLAKNRPRGEWHYFTAGVVVLGDILNKSVKNGLEEYADEKLFKPLHISNYKWQYTPQHVPNTAGGIQMNALDFAKYGQLYKNGGKWNQKQIIPEKWVNETFSKQKQIAGRSKEYYGYLFWNKTFKTRARAYEAYYCAGNGGNYILIFKDIPFVMVITASAYGQYYAHTQVTQMLTEYILPAVTKE